MCFSLRNIGGSDTPLEPHRAIRRRRDVHRHETLPTDIGLRVMIKTERNRL